MEHTLSKVSIADHEINMCKLSDCGQVNCRIQPLMLILFTFTVAEEGHSEAKSSKQHKHMLKSENNFRLIKTLLSIGMREQANSDSVEVNEPLHVEEKSLET